MEHRSGPRADEHHLRGATPSASRCFFGLLLLAVISGGGCRVVDGQLGTIPSTCCCDCTNYLLPQCSTGRSDTYDDCKKEKGTDLIAFSATQKCDAFLAQTNQRPCPPPLHHEPAVLDGAVAGKGRARLVAFVPSEGTAETSCLSKCPANALNADCASGSVSKAIASPLRLLQTWVSSGNKPVIEPAELKSIFGVDDDACHRGATVLSVTGLTNDGDSACTLEARLDSPNVRVDVYVPAHLSGQWQVPSGGMPIRLRFGALDPPTIALLNVGDEKKHYLDSAFGGAVLWAEVDDHRLMLRTSSKGCIGVSF